MSDDSSVEGDIAVGKSPLVPAGCIGHKFEVPGTWFEKGTPYERKVWWESSVREYRELHQFHKGKRGPAVRFKVVEKENNRRQSLDDKSALWLDWKKCGATRESIYQRDDGVDDQDELLECSHSHFIFIDSDVASNANDARRKRAELEQYIPDADLSGDGLEAEEAGEGGRDLPETGDGGESEEVEHCRVANGGGTVPGRTRT